MGAALAAAAARDGAAARALARAAARRAVTGAVLVLPFVLVAPGDFWDDTFGFALDEQSLQRLPLPGGWDGGFELNKILAFYMPYVLIGGLALWCVAAAALRPPLRVWAALPVALAGLAYLLARADEFHLVPLAAALPVLLAATAPHARRAALTLRRSRSPSRSSRSTGSTRTASTCSISGPLDAIHVDVADGVKAPPAEARALERTVAYIRRAVPPGRPIFVANPRHDLVRVGNPLLYVLADRENPTRYDVMQPGVVTTAPVQREIVRDLRRSRTGLVVRWLSPVAAEREPNGAGRSSGVRVLDRYLAAAYTPRGPLRRLPGPAPRPARCGMRS